MFEILATVLVFVFVFGTLAVVAWALYRCTPLPHRENPYRDADTGKRLWESPHLDGPPRWD